VKKRKQCVTAPITHELRNELVEEFVTE
jgi:hypothetical protein